MRMAGASLEAIGNRLGITPQGAGDLVTRTLAQAQNRDIAQLRELENQRLDAAQEAIWSKVLAGDLKAVDSFLRLSARRSKINGMDAPMTVELSLHVRDEMEAALAALEATVLGGTLAGEVDLPAIEARDEQAGVTELEQPEVEREELQSDSLRVVIPAPTD